MPLNNISNPTITLLRNECGVITTLPMNVTCETTNPTSFDSSDGEVSVLISGGTPPYVVTWDNGSLSQGLTNLKNGSYTATTVDYYKDYTSVTECKISTAKDCSFSGSSEIFIPPSPTPTKTPTPTPTPTPTSSLPAVICNVWEYNITIYNCSNCLPSGGGAITNSEPLTVGKWYRWNNFKIIIDAYVRCYIGTALNSILNSSQQNNCVDVICSTPTPTPTKTLTPTPTQTEGLL